MQDLEQGKYMIYEWAHTRRESGRSSFYAYSILGGERALPGVDNYTYRHSSLPPALSGVAAKSSIYRLDAYSCIFPTIAFVAVHFGQIY